MDKYIITFTVNNVKGCAVAKAATPNDAISLLRSDGFYNGTPDIYKIQSVELIPESPAAMLVCEQINDDL